jgi:hypothetical protein
MERSLRISSVILLTSSGMEATAVGSEDISNLIVREGKCE